MQIHQRMVAVDCVPMLISVELTLSESGWNAKLTVNEKQKQDDPRDLCRADLHVGDPDEIENLQESIQIQWHDREKKLFW